MPKPIFPKYEDLQFDIEKEVWNVYELDDKTTLKMRTILTKLLRDTQVRSDESATISMVGVPSDAKKLEFQATFQNIVIVAKCPLSLMGDPSPPNSLQDLASLPTTEVGYTPFYEDWNVYVLPDGLKLRVKLVVSSVSKIQGRWDQFGYPLYHVQSTNAMVPVIPKKKQ